MNVFILESRNASYQVFFCRGEVNDFQSVVGGVGEKTEVADFNIKISWSNLNIMARSAIVYFLPSLFSSNISSVRVCSQIRAIYNYFAFMSIYAAVFP